MMKQKKFKFISYTLVISILCVFALACDKDKKETLVNFANISDGQTISSPLTVDMTVTGMEILPAGEVIDGVGHFHIGIDTPPVPEGELIPTSATSFHYGDGRSSTELELLPGEHTLTLQFGDGIHRSYGESYRKTITVIVE